MPVTCLSSKEKKTCPKRVLFPRKRNVGCCISTKDWGCHQTWDKSWSISPSACALCCLYEDDKASVQRLASIPECSLHCEEAMLWWQEVQHWLHCTCCIWHQQGRLSLKWASAGALMCHQPYLLLAQFQAARPVINCRLTCDAMQWGDTKQLQCLQDHCIVFIY